MGFAFLPIGIGSLLGGWLGGKLMHQFAEVQHRPTVFWSVITAVGLITALLLWIYDKTLRPNTTPAEAASLASGT